MTQPEVHSGLVLVTDGKSRPKKMKLRLFPDSIVLQREEGTQLDHSPPLDSRERVVKVVRGEVGGLGLSVKGGAEHKLPILISRIFKDQAADTTGELFVGDAIVTVNESSLVGAYHDNAVSVLRSSGDDVKLTVRHYRAATPFLAKSIQRQSNDNEVELKIENGWKVPDVKNGNNNLMSSSNDSSNRSSPQSNTWVNIVTVPLMMAYITRYIFGTDKLRPNSFEVRSVDGVKSGIIHCEESAQLCEWIKRITNNILGLTSLRMKMYNRNLPSLEQITYMGWVCEGFLNNNKPWQNWHPKFLGIKGSSVYLFTSPPMTLGDWSNCKEVHKIYQTMFRIIKESENVDERQHCFLLQTSDTDSHYFSLETRQELLKLETSWHKTTYNAVTKLGSKTFSVTFNGKPGGLTLDWNMGFALYDTEAKTYSWKYRFSQLKGSSDDGKLKLRLDFQQNESQELEIQEIECTTLQSLLFCMHAFLTAKVASVDPSFFRSGTA